MIKRLCALVADVLGVDGDAVSPETGPLSLPQWDSLNHMRLVAAVEETYAVQFTTDEIINLLNVSDIAAALEEKGVHAD